MRWQAVGASVQGTSHAAEGLPCQDAHAIAHVGDGVVAAVCDGAGSSPYAALGASVGAESVVQALAASCRDARSRFRSPHPDAWLEAGRKAVVHARGAIARALAAELALGSALAVDLGLAHTTLVAVAAGPDGGALFHIGDGFAAVLAPEGATVSRPENGDFANETYFLTEASWSPHLRVTPFPRPVESVWLLSDGAAALATSDGALVAGFARPVSAFLRSATPEAAQAGLHGTLASASTDHLTDDDKTIVWAAPLAP